jgi:hypothetical protein
MSGVKRKVEEFGHLDALKKRMAELASAEEARLKAVKKEVEELKNKQLKASKELHGLRMQEKEQLGGAGAKPKHGGQGLAAGPGAGQAAGDALHRRLQHSGGGKEGREKGMSLQGTCWLNCVSHKKPTTSIVRHLQQAVSVFAP